MTLSFCFYKPRYLLFQRQPAHENFCL
jgi:hypothetical protein